MTIQQRVSGATAAGTNTVTLYTVPANRNFYLLYACITMFGAAAPASSGMDIRTSGAPIIRAPVTMNGNVATFTAGDLLSAIVFPPTVTVNLVYQAIGAGFNYGAEIQGVLI